MQEATRLCALHELDILDTEPEQEFEDLVQLASAICATPVSLISLVDADRQWFKAVHGLSVKETPRTESFCAHAIDQQGLFLVEDAHQDQRFRHNALVVGDPRIRFYAGVPIHTADGAALGTLCVIDMVPRQLSDCQKHALTILAAQVQARLDLRTKKKILERAFEENKILMSRLQASSDLFFAFMKHAPFASYIKEGDGTMLFYNHFLAERGGVTEQAWLGLKDDEIWPAHLAAEFRRHDIAALEANGPVESDEVSLNKDGSRSVWKTIKFPFFDENRQRTLLAGISFDVSREVAHEAELEDALREKTKLSDQLHSTQHLLRSFLDHSPNLTYIKDDQGRFVFYNQQAQNFLGIGPTDWIGRTIAEVRPHSEADKYTAEDQLVLSTGQIVDGVDNIRDRAGAMRKFRSVKFSYKDLNGRTMLAKISHDITQQIQQQEELAEANRQLQLLAMTDALTGLATRRVFDSRAEIAFGVSRRSGQPLSIVVLDVDNFKKRNDFFGHAAGDEALKVLGHILKSFIRIGDTAARLGGEEFGLLLPDCDYSRALEIAERVQAILAQADHGPTELTVSMGASTIDGTVNRWERLVTRADDAMYEAKRTGKNKVIHHNSLVADLMRSSSTPEQVPLLLPPPPLPTQANA